jgi:hypothetical protein
MRPFWNAGFVHAPLAATSDAELLMHRHWLSLILLAPLAFSVGCDTPTQAANPSGRLEAAVVQNDILHFDNVATNDCTGEQFDVVADFHFVTAVTSDGAGGFHFESHFNATDAKATSLLTGIRYVVPGTTDMTFNGNVAGGTETTQVLTFLMVSRGSAPNEVATVLLHVTVNPDGTTTSSVDHLTIRCGP